MQQTSSIYNGLLDNFFVYAYYWNYYLLNVIVGDDSMAKVERLA